MKHRNLLLVRPMRAALFVLLLMTVGTTKSLAQVQVATLHHGDEISAFYGTDAFVEAHEAAVDGDIITLSEGTFNPTYISKAITLRGAGCAVDTMAGTNPTIIGGQVTLDVLNDSVFLSIEGILFPDGVYHHTLNNPQFIKCNFGGFAGWNSDNTLMQNAQFVDCYLHNFYSHIANNTIMANCVVGGACELSHSNTLILYNSITALCGATGGLSAYNSIIVNCCNHAVYSTSSFHNCIGIGTYAGSEWAFHEGYAVNCIHYDFYDDVFESFTGFPNNVGFSFEEDFILKDEIATGFLGTDGTQVGIHGGAQPYNRLPNYMVRTQVTVPAQSANDGTLNIEIEIIDEDE